MLESAPQSMEAISLRDISNHCLSHLSRLSVLSVTIVVAINALMISILIFTIKHGRRAKNTPAGLGQLDERMLPGCHEAPLAI
jgi:hypothetical protein